MGFLLNARLSALKSFERQMPAMVQREMWTPAKTYTVSLVVSPPTLNVPASFT